ncbi:GAF domain-containing protein [Mucilaginibacter sp. SP1R1]|uniref:GAF domain-containing protein n=1 Tax=Mucilaginibacter sp. SP1R1 TaxID=2723091 RepID=UPI00161957C2|nr:GAF domain-containing protein [Mucilaginibacter sp. SP1R1]MBB6151997.1 PAS domain S-box-containing protein [Mucilaginibacter sp. SP1R1]
MSNKQQRLQKVNKLKELEGQFVADLNEIIDLAIQMCNVSLGFVTLLDTNRHWFKANPGTDIVFTKKEAAFCNYVVEQNDAVVIPDTAADERFNQEQQPVNTKYARFYAGTPLVTKDGFVIGSLCIVDFEPTQLSAGQVKSLKVLAKQVVNLMDLNLSLRALEQHHEQTQIQKMTIGESEMKLKAIFDSSKDTHILVGRQLEVLAFNKSASVFIRNTYNKKLSHGDNIMDYTDPYLTNQFAKYFAIAMAGRSIKREWILKRDSAHACWKQTSFIPVKDNTGVVIGVALNSTDITTRKKHEEQIKIQNEALQRIAIIQSHELRRPVASLLGMMDLMRIEKIDFGYFKMMEHTINELDEKIRDIVKDSEDTIQVRHLAIVA